MKRRKALEHIGIGLTAGMVMPGFLASCQKDDPGPEVPYNGNVIVIGAGAAGLYAADILRVKGIRVTVLEAASQPGGRVRSLRNQTDVQYQTFSNASQADFPIELGAEVIYGSNSSWGKIISDLGIITKEIDPAAARYILDNTAKKATDLSTDADYLAVQSFLSTLADNTSSASLQNAANVSSRAQALLNAQVANHYGSNANKIGTKGLAESLKLITHDQKQLTTFSNPWQDILLSRFNGILPEIKYNTIVKKIDWSGNVITVTDSNNKTYTATKIVITVPLSILKTGGITFTPSLPSGTTSAMSKFGMDAAVRLILDFKSNFWGLDSSFIWGGTTMPQYFNSGLNRSKYFRTMSLTVYGQKAQELSALSDYDKTLAVLAELDAIYNGDGTKYIRRDLNNNNNDSNILSLVKDWTTDEFTKGGFSYPLVGATLQDRKNLAAPVSKKLYFAGEATDFSGDAGFVSGALNSAVRVSTEIVDSILNA
ncbi:MAG: flavin monoamine oxidase family protein [Cyclobacteriaceae bacterium]|jgi:monoamine oxidase|nr:FAD-dependent oxidoreductase [Flammeovirgaceae bacterium]